MDDNREKEAEKELVEISLKFTCKLKTESVDFVMEEVQNISLLAVPESFKKIKNILITYDGSFAASRVLHRFVNPASLQNYSFVILTSSANSDKVRPMSSNVFSYLISYGNKKVSKAINFKNIYQAIKSNYLNWIDLFVLGVHSKNKFKYLIINSLTKELININKKPLFIGFYGGVL